MRLPSFVSRCASFQVVSSVCLGVALLLPAAASAQTQTCMVTSTVDSATAGTTPGTLRYCAQQTIGPNFSVDLSALPPLSVITLAAELEISPYATVLHGRADGGVTIAGGNATPSLTFFGYDTSVDHLVFHNVLLESGSTNLSLTDVTVFGSTSTYPAVQAGTITLTDSTVTGNAGGGLSGLIVNLNQSTVYGNAFYDVATPRPPAINRSIVGIISGTPPPTAKGSYLGTTAQLGPLQFNGSLFPTMLPLVNSAAIGIGGMTTADERGFPGKSTGDAGAVQTNYITVTSLGDTATGTCTANSCTLRQAINTANANAGGDITFGSLATAASPGTVTLTSVLPNVTSLVDIAGPGANALSVSGAGGYRITNVVAGGSLAFNGLTATAANAYPLGAALTNSGLLTLAHSAVTGTTGGSAINNGYNSSSGTVAAVLSASTISGNNSIDQSGGIFSTAALRVLDSTFSGNTSTNGAGGGIAQSGATLFIAGSTISANSSAPGQPGGGILVEATTATIANSIVEGNSTGGVYPDFTGTFGSYTDGGGNLVNTTQGATLNPGLGPLANNGGTTQTMLPLPGSPAICVGSAANGQAYGTTTDERGATHSTAYCSSTQLDAGAVQTSYSKLAFVQQPANTALGSTLNPAPTMALTEDGMDAGNVPLTVTGAGADGLTGTTTETTAPGSVATFNNLQFSTGMIEQPANLRSSAAVTPSGYSGTPFTLSSISSNFEITGPPYGSMSMLVLSPSTIAVGDTSTATVTARDQVGYPISGVAVTVTTSNGSVATVPTQMVTGASGVATFTVSGTGPGSAIITANFAGGVGHTSATLMVAGPPSSATSSLVAAPGQADVGSTSTVTATVEDAAGNPIPNAAVSVNFTSASAPVTVTQGSMTNQFAAGQAGSFGGTTNASGQVVYSLTAGAPTQVTINGTGGNSASNFRFSQTPVVTFAQPGFIVTVSTDDATGVPANCADQATNPTGTNTNCSLRDAIAAANAEGVGAVANITFSQKLLAGSPVTITEGSGGTLTITNGMTIQGLSGTPGQISVSGANAYGVFDVNPGTGAGAVTFNSLTITQGKNVSKGSGGGIEVDGGVVTVAGSTISGNSGSSGGGMVIDGGTVTVTGSTISNNTSPNGGSGGIITSANSSLAVIGSTISGNSAGGNSFGGGIAVGIGTMGPVTITGSTLSGNSATAGSALFVGSAVTLANSTLSRNSAGESGAIFQYITGNLIVTGSTISGNTAVSNTTGIVSQGGTQTINNTLITDTVSGFVVPTNQGNVTNGGNLSTLGNFGGPTQTILPLPGSPAICGGVTADIASGFTTDQRGAARTTAYGTKTCVDAGAVETHYALAFAIQPGNVLANTSISPSPTVSLSENGVAFNAASEALPLTLSGNGTLSGGSASTATTNGVATYNGLQVSAPGTGDTLTANLVLNASPATMIAATSNTFNVAAQAPTVLSIVPNSGPATGGTTVTISGSNFTSGSTTVQFGTANATSVTVNSSTSLTATSPAGAPGTVNVTVATAAGTTTLSAAFTYVGPTAYLVTTLTDDATGDAANCFPAATSNAPPNYNCSLRDAVAAANALPSGVAATINFYSPLFTTATRTNPAVSSIGANGNLNITGAVTINGPTGSDAGGLFNELAIDGSGSSNGIFYLNTGSAAVVLNQLIVRNGSSTAGGGGITVNNSTLTINGCTLSGNSAMGAGTGGGIYFISGTLTVNGSTLSGNSAASGFGGGISASGGALTINRSTLNSNSAPFGGGIYIDGGTVAVNGSTFSGNSASFGGGIYIDGGTVAVNGSTFSGNSASFGGGIDVNHGTLTVSNALVPDSVDGYTISSGRGNVTSGANLSGLGNFGGPTQTILPMPGSPAICGGLVSVANGAPANNQAYTDQRGATHSAAYCSASQLDAGAVQTSYSLGSGFTVNPPSTVSPGAAITPGPAVTVTENALAASGEAVALSAANGMLNGTTTVSSETNGVATFSGVSITGNSSGDTLTATLNLGTTAGAPQVTVTSTAFNAASLTPGTLPSGTVGVAYSQTLSVNGGSGPYTYSISAGMLPAGITLGASTGTISGTPSAGGNFPFSVSASNGSGNAVTQGYTLAIAGATVMLTPATLPAFTVGMQASVTFTAVGGTAPYNYSSTGMLPPGLTLNPTTGVLSGSPTAGGTYTFTILAKDSSAGTGPYSGSRPYTDTVGTATATVNVAGASAVYGAATVQLSATVTFSAGVTPTGPFSFQIGSNPAVAATCAPASSTTETCKASYNTAALAASSYTIVATQAADANYSTASGMGTLTIGKATPTLSVADQSVAYGTPNATLSAMVAYSGGVPSGTVSFTVDGGAPVIATCNANASPETCTATYPTANLLAGMHTVSASLAADANYTAATATGTLTISAVTPTITFAVANHAYGDPPFAVMATSNSSGAFTYTVVSGNATLSGNVVSLTGIGTVVLQASEAADPNYTAGSQQTSFMVAPAPLNVTANNASRYYGAADPAFTGTVAGQKYNDTFTETFVTNPSATSISAPGVYSIVPAAAGANLGDYSVTTLNGTLTVTQAPTTATLTVSATTINPNQTVTLMATIASTTSGVPTGSVTFFDNGMALGIATLVKGTATYTATLLPSSTNSLTVSYSGDGDFLSSSSGSALTVSVAPLSFTFTATSATALTEAPGKVAAYSFQISPNFGSYASAVTFSVTGLPPGATATFTPTSVAPGGGVQTVVMSVQTPPALAREQVPSRPFGPLQLPLLALLLLPMLGSREMRRRLGSRLLMLMLLLGGLAGVAGMTGCGSSNGFLLEQPATYTLTVTATAGTLAQSQTVTLQVQ